MLGAAIRQARDQAGISQEKLAELVGVSRQAVSKWERGQAVPTMDNLSRMEAALHLPCGALTGLMTDQGTKPSSVIKPSKKGVWLFGSAALILLLVTFWVGRMTAPVPGSGTAEATVAAYTSMGSAEGRRAAFPMDESGTIRLDLPLSAPGEEDRLVTQLEFYQWPETLALEVREMIDFDRNPPWGPTDEYLSEGWELLSQLSLEEPDGAVLGLAHSMEEYDGPTLWILARGNQDAQWTVLERMNEDALCWKTAQDGTRAWAVPVGNVLGYDGLLVEYYDSALLLAMVNGAPRVVFHIPDHLQGFADLDLDGELEIICRPVEGPYEIYVR